MKAKSIKGNTVNEIAAALDVSTTDGFTPTLAIVFLSIKQDRTAITELLNEKGMAVFGATTAGEFIDGDIGEGSIAMMLLDMNSSYFRLWFEEATAETLSDTAKKLAEAAKETFQKPAFLMAATMFANAEIIVNAIEEEFEEEVTLFGAQAGDDLTRTGAYVFTNHQHTQNGLLSIIIDEEKVSIKGLATSGWKAVGTVRTITKSEAGTVYTIDDQPAYDVFLKYLGGTEAAVRAVDESVVINEVGAFFPILMLRDDAEPVIRASMFSNPTDRSVTFGGSVPQGTQFRFSLPPDFDVVDKVVEESVSLKEQHLPQADAMILFSCVARHLTLGPLVSEEIEQLQKVWNAPMVGFFSYGEMGKSANGKHEYHNNTCCLVVLKEVANKNNIALSE